MARPGAVHAATHLRSQQSPVFAAVPATPAGTDGYRLAHRKILEQLTPTPCLPGGVLYQSDACRAAEAQITKVYSTVTEGFRTMGDLSAATLHMVGALAVLDSDVYIDTSETCNKAFPQYLRAADDAWSACWYNEGLRCDRDAVEQKKTDWQAVCPLGSMDLLLVVGRLGWKAVGSEPLTGKLLMEIPDQP